MSKKSKETIVEVAQDTLKIQLGLLCTTPERFILKSEKNLINIAKINIPKKSKILPILFLKDLFLIEESRLLILKIHLYLENFLIEIIDNKFKNYKILEKNGIINSFYKKVILLKSQNFLDDALSNDLLYINEIRNKFAHNLRFNMQDINVNKFHYLKKYKFPKFRSKKVNESLYRQIIKMNTMLVFAKLLQKYKFIDFMKL